MLTSFCVTVCAIAVFDLNWTACFSTIAFFYSKPTVFDWTAAQYMQFFFALVSASHVHFTFCLWLDFFPPLSSLCLRMPFSGLLRVMKKYAMSFPSLEVCVCVEPTRQASDHHIQRKNEEWRIIQMPANILCKCIRENFSEGKKMQSENGRWWREREGRGKKGIQSVLTTGIYSYGQTTKKWGTQNEDKYMFIARAVYQSEKNALSNTLGKKEEVEKGRKNRMQYAYIK